MFKYLIYVIFSIKFYLLFKFWLNNNLQSALVKRRRSCIIIFKNLNGIFILSAKIFILNDIVIT